MVERKGEGGDSQFKAEVRIYKETGGTVFGMTVSRVRKQ